MLKVAKNLKAKVRGWANPCLIKPFHWCKCGCHLMLLIACSRLSVSKARLLTLRAFNSLSYKIMLHLAGNLKPPLSWSRKAKWTKICPPTMWNPPTWPMRNSLQLGFLRSSFLDPYASLMVRYHTADVIIKAWNKVLVGKVNFPCHLGHFGG